MMQAQMQNNEFGQYVSVSLAKKFLPLQSYVTVS